MPWLDEDGKESKEVRLAVWTFLLAFVLFLTVHFILFYPRISHSWDGFDLSTDTSVSIDTGTRETITDTVIIEPGYDISVTDSEDEVIELEVITVNPDTGGPVQIEGFDYETGTFIELEMAIK
tara:strand:+ start:298 stop:666 length:369 start_codon:yes stop_codon:yes gene_type:complete